MPLTFRCGLYFPDAGQAIQVESSRFLGRTKVDMTPGPQRGKQTYWFADKAEFDREVPNIIMNIGRGTIWYPIPVFQMLGENDLPPVEKPAQPTIQLPPRRGPGRPPKPKPQLQVA